MAATITTEPTTQAQGDYINLVGSEFGAGEVIKVFVNGHWSDTFQSETDGTFSARVDIPTGAPDGTNTVRAFDESGNSATASVTVS